MLETREVVMTTNMKLEGYYTWTEFHTEFATVSSSLNMLCFNVLSHVLFAAVAVCAVSAPPQASCWTFNHVR